VFVHILFYFNEIVSHRQKTKQDRAVSISIECLQKSF